MFKKNICANLTKDKKSVDFSAVKWYSGKVIKNK